MYSSQVDFYVMLNLCVAALAVLSFTLWVLSGLRRRALEKELALKELAIAISKGGYAILNIASNRQDYFSNSLLAMLSMHKEQISFNNIFKNDEEICNIIQNLKSGVVGDASTDYTFYGNDFEKKLELHFNRVNDKLGNLAYIIVWFCDKSKNVQQIESLIKTNKQLLRKVEVFEQILDNIPFPVWRRQASGRVSYGNKLFYDTLKENFVDRKETRKVSNFLKQVANFALNANKSVSKKLKIASENRVFEINEAPLVGQEATSGVAIEVTKYESTELLLQKYLVAYKEVLESSPNSIVVFDDKQKLQYYNNTYKNMWDFTEDFLKAEPSFSEVLENLRARNLLEEQVDFKIYRQEQIAMFSNQNLIPGENHIHLPDGRIILQKFMRHALGGLIFGYQDLSERFKLESSFNSLMAVQKAILDSISEAIAVFGSDGMLKLYNPKYLEIWHLTEDDLKAELHVDDLMEMTKDLHKYSGNWDDFKKQRVLENVTGGKKFISWDLINHKTIEKTVVPLPNGGVLVTFIEKQKEDAYNAA